MSPSIEMSVSEINYGVVRAKSCNLSLSRSLALSLSLPLSLSPANKPSHPHIVTYSTTRNNPPTDLPDQPKQKLFFPVDEEALDIDSTSSVVELLPSRVDGLFLLPSPLSTTSRLLSAVPEVPVDEESPSPPPLPASQHEI